MRILLLACLVLSITLPVYAQDPTPETQNQDYIITLINSSIDRTIEMCKELSIESFDELANTGTVEQLEECGVQFDELTQSISALETEETTAAGITMLQGIVAAGPGHYRIAMTEFPTQISSGSNIVVIDSETENPRYIYIDNANMPDPTQWAQCALDWITANQNGTELPTPLKFPLDLNGDNGSTGEWSCEIHFSLGTGGSAQIDLFTGNITTIRIGTASGDERMIGLFIKETIGSASSIRQMKSGYIQEILFHAEGYDTSLIANEIVTLSDAMAIFFLPPAQREILDVPEYTPYGLPNSIVSAAIVAHCLSTQGFIRTGGLPLILEAYEIHPDDISCNK